MAQEPSGVDAAQQALESLANYLRLRALYPAKNHRVCAARDTVLDWVWQAAVGGRTVRIRVAPDRAEIDGIPIEIASPNLRWLAEQTLRVAIGGVDLTAALNADALDQFAVLMQKAAAGSPTPLIDSWPRDANEVRPIPLVFSGSHLSDSATTAPDGSAREARARFRTEFVRRVHSDPRLRLHLAALQARLDDHSAEGETRQELPILDRILELAQGDAGFAEKNPVEVIEKALATIDREIVARLEVAESSPQSAFSETSLRVAHRFFTPKTEIQNNEADESAVTERPEDRTVIDDLDGLIVDLLSLPWGGHAPVFDDNQRQREHHLGILAELIESPLQSSTPTQAAAAIGRLAREHHDLDLSRIRTLLEGHSGATAGADEANGNMALETLRAFHAAGCIDTVFQRRLAQPELLGAEFPTWFGEWVDSLMPGRPEDADLFARTLASIPPASFDDGFQRLFSSEVLPGTDRLERILLLANERAGALLARLLQFHPGVMRGFALRWLFDASLPALECAALRLLPADRIPGDHLGRLCLLADGDTRHRSRIIEESGALLRRFAIEGVDAMHHERRLRIIRALMDFPSAQTRGVLEDLASGWGIASAERRELRNVAKEVLRTIRSRPCA